MAIALPKTTLRASPEPFKICLFSLAASSGSSRNDEQVIITLFCLVNGGKAGAGNGGSFQVGESGGQTGSGGGSKSRGGAAMAGKTLPQQPMSETRSSTCEI